jgi:hypothetical protein
MEQDPRNRGRRTRDVVIVWKQWSRHFVCNDSCGAVIVCTKYQRLDRRLARQHATGDGCRTERRRCDPSDQ